jgi:hypothetical protein
MMWKNVYYSFPIQLFLLHIRKNYLLLALWALLFAIVLESFGTVLGIPFLFLDPEYLNQVSWQGFFFIGLGLGIFTIAFHMTTYILDGVKFKFLAVVKRPFLQFTINNSLIPLLFYGVFVFQGVRFQLSNAHDNHFFIVELIGGFLVGLILIYLIIFLYLTLTHKDFFVLFADEIEKKMKKSAIPRANMLKRIQENKKVQFNVTHYFDSSLRFKEATKDLSQFERLKLLRVFDQNHLNLFIIQMILVVFIFFLSAFREEPYLQIPAAASALLLMSVVTMMVGALAFWLREWATPVVFILLLLFNSFSDSSFFQRPYPAFGLNYQSDPASYALEDLDKIFPKDSVQEDVDLSLGILERWRSTFPTDVKPRLILVTTSGGGQRAAVWTLKVLQEAEQASKGQLMKHTRLMTGASGGMIGAAFFRELYWRSLYDHQIILNNPEYLHQISSDNLNPIIFTLLVNDLLIRTKYFSYQGKEYLKDRGFSFENQLNINTKGVLNKPLYAYRIPEYTAQIPLMPITPLITNDGRKLIISATSMSYLGISYGENQDTKELFRGLDFVRFFKHQDAEKLRFLTALRMGATFPFITPQINLPSKPVIATMDAGLSDNYGMRDALGFLYVFKEWIAENTSGVTLITIRDSEKNKTIEKEISTHFLQKLFIPLKSIYSNWDKVQTLNNESLFYYLKQNLGFEVDRIEFEYATSDLENELKDNNEGVLVKTQRASLNWRLTNKEKNSIIDNIRHPLNQSALEKVRNIEYVKR